MVIDFHTHCFADRLAPVAVPLLERECGIKGFHDGTIAGLRQQMAAGGVDISVIQPVATKPAQVQVINEWAKANADDTLYFFGALHPDDEAFFENVKRLKQDGFRGVKLHPDYQGFFADEPRMMPLYRAIADLGLVLVLHCGVDIGRPWPVHCTPLMVAHILENVPDLCLVASHMGSHGLWRDAQDVLVGKSLYLDTSYSQYSLKKEGMERMIRRHGAQRVLFGTDSPWTSAAVEIAGIRALDLPESDIESILSGNAKRLLGLF